MREDFESNGEGSEGNGWIKIRLLEEKGWGWEEKISGVIWDGL